ncbi:MAG: glutaminase A [Leptolyngbyaceae cyanobacterium SU_3_3]|nr:glutaminase A [Leptolyngbyaceae cyanobacterium SU_3_3]NJR48284.1 glutaminase A [Leptolyngbyaceae cyanobacterium CSU_1_3]
MIHDPLVRLDALTQAKLSTWVDQAKPRTQWGRLPDYIPRLAQIDASILAVNIQTTTGQEFLAGAGEQRFALMSVIKPFVLLFLLERSGAEEVFKYVGTQPSDQPFHSLTQLSVDRGFPRNPMINSGAIALGARLPGKDGATRCEHLRQWLNQSAGSQLALDRAILESVCSLSNESNRAIAKMLSQAGKLEGVEVALDTYNHICCLSGTVADLARLGLLLAQRSIIAPSHQRMVNALMLTCGLYEASGQVAVRVGLPTKSGVSGALLAIVPHQGSIACYSPAIDPTGNSVAGMFLLEKLATSLDLSIFG